MTAEEPDLERRFGGVVRLYGRAAYERFRAAHVCVIGIGGVGSWAAEALARNAIGRITLVDLDHVAESNTNRQIHALEPEYGKAKVLAMAERVLAINPGCQVTSVEEFVEPDNLEQLLGQGFDVVIDCIDNYRTKAALIAWCRRRRQFLVTVGGAGGQVDPTRIRLADLARTEQDALLAKTRKLLRREYGFPANPKRRFDIPCVFSDEQPRFPDGEGGVCQEKQSLARGGHALHCGGFGSGVTVTATFGLVAVARALKRVSEQAV